MGFDARVAVLVRRGARQVVAAVRVRARLSGFGDYQRQLFAVDGLALPVDVALEQVELLGTEVVPVLRKELESRRAPNVPDAPTHASLVTAKYGDAEPRQPRPNPNRGDKLSGTSPYQDSDPDVEAVFPAVR